MIETNVDALRHELARLRAGHGIQTRRTASQVGTELRRLCGIEPHDDPSTITRKLAGELGSLIHHLPAMEQLVANAAFAMQPDAPRFVSERLSRLAEKLGVSTRTAHRRMADAIDMMAHGARGRAASRPSPGLDSGLITDELRHLLLLDRPIPELMQERRIVATDHVARIDGAFGLPGSADIETDLLFGGLLTTVERRSTVLRYVIEPPHPLGPGEAFSYALRLGFPHEPPSPHHIVMAAAPIRSLSMRVRFDPTRRPAQVWRVDSALPRETDDPREGAAVAPDRAGEVVATFRDLYPGRSYGLAWTWSGDGDAAGGLGLEAY